jgi:hypothetical protein
VVQFVLEFESSTAQVNDKLTFDQTKGEKAFQSKKLFTTLFSNEKKNENKQSIKRQSRLHNVMC